MIPKIFKLLWEASSSMPGETVQILVGLRKVDGKTRVFLRRDYIIKGKQGFMERFLDKEDMLEYIKHPATIEAFLNHNFQTQNDELKG